MVSVHGAAQAMQVNFPDDHMAVVICTGSEMRQITFNAEGELVAEQGLPMDGVFCYDCLAATKTYAFLPTVQVAVQVPIKGYDYTAEYQAPVAFDKRPDNLHCLDPPTKPNFSKANSSKGSGPDFGNHSSSFKRL